MGELAKADKIGAGGVGVFVPRRHGHQATQFEIGQGGDGVDELGKVRGRAAVFGFFGGELDFETDFEGTRGGLREAAGLGLSTV
jgi:hypothetical protein